MVPDYPVGIHTVQRRLGEMKLLRSGQPVVEVRAYHTEVIDRELGFDERIYFVREPGVRYDHRSPVPVHTGKKPNRKIDPEVGVSCSDYVCPDVLEQSPSFHVFNAVPSEIRFADKLQ